MTLEGIEPTPYHERTEVVGHEVGIRRHLFKQGNGVN